MYLSFIILPQHTIKMNWLHRTSTHTHAKKSGKKDDQYFVQCNQERKWNHKIGSINIDSISIYTLSYHRLITSPSMDGFSLCAAIFFRFVAIHSLYLSFCIYPREKPSSITLSFAQYIESPHT